jgi:hypothetical protein
MSQDFPFLSITDCLTSNKCWLCEAPFPRGITKKVFQVHQLLEYFENLKQHKLSTAAEIEEKNLIKLNAFSTNLQRCFQYYVENTNEGKESVFKQLRDHDLDLWMSGLVCALTDSCASDAALFIKSNLTPASKVQSEAKPKVPIGITFANKDCPPGCGCDNPWAFLS